MSENSKIEWCDHTFNPWEGCQKVSPGCDHCYAETRNARFGGGTAINWGPGAPRRRTSPANWALPLKWDKRAGIMQNAWAHGVELHGGDEAACITAGFIKPQRPKVFCASLADVFDNEVDTQWRVDLFKLIAKMPNLDWLILTKRIGNAKAMLHDAGTRQWNDGIHYWDEEPWSNVWIGATICNQIEAIRDIPKLLAMSAAKRFLSMEPLLGAVDLERWLEPCGLDTDLGLSNPGINWVIVGGESGPNARPMHPVWARSLRDQCKTAGVPFLFKQWGEWAKAYPRPSETPGRFRLIPRYQSAFVSTSELDAYPRQFTAFGSDIIERVGKKAAGRLLDGITHDGVPT